MRRESLLCRPAVGLACGLVYGLTAGLALGRTNDDMAKKATV